MRQKISCLFRIQFVYSLAEQRRSELNKRVGLAAWMLLLALGFIFLTSASVFGFEKKQPLEISPGPLYHPPVTPMDDFGFCTIQYDSGLPLYYFHDFGAGEGIAVYIDPDTTEDSLNPGLIKPGLSISGHNKIFTIPQDSAYDMDNPTDPMNLYLDTNFCVTAPFFMEILNSGTNELLYPGVIFGDVTDLPETLTNWVKWGGHYIEWSDFWENPVPGRAIIRVTGYPRAIDCEICWKWMPKTTKAPSGMPDFDQYQFGPDSLAMSGPTAVANCLVWHGVLSSFSDPGDLIRLLSDYFHTDPDSGTSVDSIKAGLDSLFADYGLDLNAIPVESPTFRAVADSLILKASITLLVGFWQKIGGSWYRNGGHYVSAAGACKSNSWIAISDPAVDGAESGARGNILPTHDPHPEDDTLHNTKGFVSHDAYLSDTLSIGSQRGSWIIRAFDGDTLPWAAEFDGLNFQIDQDYHAYDPAESLYAVVEYASMIMEKPTLVEEEELETPVDFELFQSYPNPFNNHTLIRYRLSKTTEVSLVIYNVLGQKVRTLVEREKQNGPVTVSWDGRDDGRRDLSSGIYFYRLQAGEFSQTRRMVLLK
jgi:hypothetical protein